MVASPRPAAARRAAWPRRCRRCWSPPSGSRSTVAQGVHGRRRVGQGETFWQFRHYQPATAAPDRLAQSAKSQHSIRARDRMGGGAERLAVARRLALDGLALERAGARQARARRAAGARAGRAPGARRRARGPARHRTPRRDRPGRAQPARDPAAATEHPEGEPAADRAAAAPLPHRPDRRFPVAACRRSRPPCARFAGQGVHGHLLQVLDPAEETCPSPAASASRAWRARASCCSAASRACATDYAERSRTIARGWRRSRARSAGPSPAPHRPPAADRRCWRSTQQLARRGQVLGRCWRSARFAFAAPWMLLALAGVPVIWWLLRVTPPAPSACSSRRSACCWIWCRARRRRRARRCG